MGQYKMHGWRVKNLKVVSNVPIKIEFAKGTETKIVNKWKSADGCLFFIETYQFEAGRKTVVTIANTNTDGMVKADAFKFELLE